MPSWVAVVDDDDCSLLGHSQTLAKCKMSLSSMPLMATVFASKLKDTAGKLDVLGHDSDTLSKAEVGKRC